MSESKADCPVPLLDKHHIVRIAGAGAQFYLGENNPHMSLIAPRPASTGWRSKTLFWQG